MATDNNDGFAQTIPIDLNDTTYQALAKYAGRTAGLLESQKAKANPALEPALDDFLGAVYSLILAKHHGFEGRPNRQTEGQVIIARAKDLAHGKLRTDGKWMAGLHFNSGLYRTSGVFHRLLKLVVDDEKNRSEKGDKLKSLLRDAEARYQKWTGNNWSHPNAKGINEQVNDLKHDPNGIHERRRPNAGFENALSALGELLNLVEAWAGAPPT